MTVHENRKAPPEERGLGSVSKVEKRHANATKDKSASQANSIGVTKLSKIIAATHRAENLLTLWQEHHQLEHRLRYTCLQFAHLGINNEAVAGLSREIATWRRTVEALARGA